MNDNNLKKKNNLNKSYIVLLEKKPSFMYIQIIELLLIRDMLRLYYKWIFIMDYIFQE